MYDVAVIGSGPGGYVAAIRAAQLGNKVLLIEKSKLGGVCLNQGCIPTKVLLNSGEIFYKTAMLENYGIEVSSVQFNISKAVQRARSISQKLVTGINSLVKKNKIDLIYGIGSFKNKNCLIVSKNDNNIEEIQAKNIIIATGARPKDIPNIKIDHDQIWDYSDALFPTKIPKNIVIIGSGAIGMEFASFYNQVGSDVTVLEAKGEILPSEDTEIVQIAKSSFEKRGIKFFTGVHIEKVLKDRSNIKIEFLCNNKTQYVVNSDVILLAVGINANLEELCLENINLKLSNNLINTKDNMETDIEGVFAIGDVTNNVPWLAHKASHEGIIVAEAISNKKFHKINYNNIPICIYSSPEIASIGFTEQESLDRGYEINVGRFPFRGNGKALIIGDSEGMIKTIFDKNTGEILGAHMVGSHVTELIHSYSIAKNAELTDSEVMNTIFPHPTLSEMIHESSLDSLKRSIHI